MATYAIGDLHGCFDQLLNLLDQIKYDQQQDVLWFTGDLINGGPKPVETVRFIKELGDRAICVLGNHDLTLLRITSCDLEPPKSKRIGFEPILHAPDRQELIDWLRGQPLSHYDPSFNALLVHAGVLPSWDLTTIQSLSSEIEIILQAPNIDKNYYPIYGNTPYTWDNTLRGDERARFILNCLTRMRFCTPFGGLEFEHNGNANSAPTGYMPWYAVPNRMTKDVNIIFGHWSAIAGETGVNNAFAIDTGCMWGGRLTALRLDDWQTFSVPGLKI